MIENIKDLGLDDLDQAAEDFWEKANVLIKEKLGLGLEDFRSSLTSAMDKKAEEIALEMPNIAPNGDYGKLIEDNDSMTKFLREEASKGDSWGLYEIANDPRQAHLYKFTFKCKAVDDGNSLNGYVFVNNSGIIRHSFVQVES